MTLGFPVGSKLGLGKPGVMPYSRQGKSSEEIPLAFCTLQSRTMLLS